MRRSRRFGWTLAAVAFGALAVRVAYVLIERRDFVPGGDALFYHKGANLLAEGQGFISPFFYPARHVQAAEHPPLYTIFLAVPSRLGMHSVLTHVLWSCALGTATVVLVGLLGRIVAGDAAGIIAAVLAAMYPNIWAPDGMLQAETLGMFTVALAVLLAYRYLRAPSWQRMAWLGGACGLGALARSELVLLVPILVVPLALLTRDQPWNQRLKWLGVAVAATAVLIAPWSIYNATRFAHPIWLSAQIDPLLAAANCDSTYYGPLNGYFDIQCNAAVDARAGLTDRDDESQRGIADRRAALHYIRGHLERLPYVEGVRALRILGLYHPQEQIVTDTFVEGRDEWVARDGLFTFWIMGVLAIAGAVVLRRRRTVPLYPLLAPVGVVVVTVLVTYASTRFRSTAEPVLAVLAALAIEALFTRVRGAARSGGGEELVAVAGGDRHDRALGVDAGRVGEQ